MNAGKTQQIAAQARQDLAPKSGEHWLRMIAGCVAILLGTCDIVISRFVREGPWEKEPIALIVIGLGIIFTKTVIELAKALLPWKSRNG